MLAIAVIILGGLVFLSGLSIYSALMLSKRTDEMVAQMEEDDESLSPIVVHFPRDVFESTKASE
ncbi:MAG: hypothetical protein ABFD54_14365 [Armatimonadota bacterium]|nr:hypothetical protein [bacterium]